MNYGLLARFASLEEDEDRLVFALSADELGIGKYVMLQQSLKPEEQESRLRLDGLYIECDDQINGCYLAVKSIRQVDHRIEIGLTEQGERHLKVKRISITPMPWSATISRGLARLAELSRGEYEVEYR